MSADVLHQTLWRIVLDLPGATAKLTDAELSAYARGVGDALILAMENCPDPVDRAAHDGSAWRAQLVGAVGEALRRRHPQDRACPGRKLNEWLCAIRDRRIAFIDDTDTADDLLDWRRNLMRYVQNWERLRDRHPGLTTEEWQSLQQVRTELNALRELYDFMTHDRAWWQRRRERYRKVVADCQRLNLTEGIPA